MEWYDIRSGCSCNYNYVRLSAGVKEVVGDLGWNGFINDGYQSCGCYPVSNTNQKLANIGKRKPQQTIDRECASVNYTESASA